MAVGLRSLPFGIAPAGSANQSQVVDLGFEFAAFFGSAGSSPRYAAADAKRLHSQLAGNRANRLVACGAIAAGPMLTWSKDGTAVAGLLQARLRRGGGAPQGQGLARHGARGLRGRALRCLTIMIIL